MHGGDGNAHIGQTKDPCISLKHSSQHVWAQGIFCGFRSASSICSKHMGHVISACVNRRRFAEVHGHTETY